MIRLFGLLFALLGFFSVTIKIKAQDEWVITADTIISKEYYGISVSNGQIGMVSSDEPLKVKEVILAGVYDNYGRGRTNNFLPSFNLLNLNLSIGWQDINKDNISNYKQELDMRTGKFSARFDFKDFATVEYSYYALRHLPHNVMMDVKIIPHQDTYIVAENVLQTPQALKNNQLYYNEINPSHAYIPLLTSIAQSPSGKTTIVASNTFLFDQTYSNEKSPRILHEIRDNDSHLMKFVLPVKKGVAFTFSLVGTLISSEDVKDPYNQAERLSIYANLQGRENLIKNHNKAWETLWQGDIKIEGDKQAQQDIHNMLYHLYAFTREGTNLSLSPMGLSGLGYNGHVFWDTEIFMFMPLLLLQPQLAKNFVEYRFDRLEAAEKKARSYGYQGAMFSWESAMTGEEETPVWALSGTYEHHISADVAFATWYYYLVTQDKEWLKDKGWHILKKTADFWVSRAEKNSDRYEIRNVVCADEWAENVDNNAYTNAVAKMNLQSAHKVAQILGFPTNEKWMEIAENLVFSKMENGVTREHDSYNGQNIKQADVNLLAYPLKEITDQAQIKKDLEYYEVKVPYSDTPAMTQAIFSLLYSRLGDVAKATKWFEDSYQDHLLPPFRVMAETKGGTNPYFITGAGGILQTIMMGFAGIDIDEKGNIKQIKSVMPASWEKITITNVGRKKEKIERTKQN